MIELIDTHAHLDDEKFHADLEQVLERARQAGVCKIVTIATTGLSSEASVRLAERYPQLGATVGLQPNNLAQEPADGWDRVVRLVEHPRVVALGETGLDRHWDFTPFPQQEDYFARHLALARQHRLPVVIHCRKAEADVVRMLRDDFERHGPVRGVMHSFTGDLATAEACLAMGLSISFAGMLTYKNAEDLRQVAKQVPLDRLLVETDSPYLAPSPQPLSPKERGDVRAPVPVRGKRNEPGFVVHTAACLAALHGLAGAVLAEKTTENAHGLFAKL